MIGQYSGVVALAAVVWPLCSFAQDVTLDLGPEEIVQAGGVDLVVRGWSVPSMADWNSDGLADLVVGEGGFDFVDVVTYQAKVRVYLNGGTETDPQFDTFSYVQSDGRDLALPGQGCLGCFPRVVHWDADERKDLLVGQAGGTVRIYLNIGTEETPTFDAGQIIGVGDQGSQALDVGARASPNLVDFNEDGMLDLVVGGLDGLIHLYANCGCGGAVPPRFYFSDPEGNFVQAGGFDLEVPGRRSSPVVADLDGDGRMDILTGNTNGELLFYRNTSVVYPHEFADPVAVTSQGAPIVLPALPGNQGPRSRPAMCYWTGGADGYWDILVGSGDGLVRLYRGLPATGDLNADGVFDFADFALFARAWRVRESEGDSAADLDIDGIVDGYDLEILAALWLSEPR
jgi:hypothetical protein